MSSSATDAAAPSPKAIVRQVLDRMPEDATFEEIAEEIAILTALEAAEDDIRSGRVSSDEEVKQRARRWRSR
jgi:predicted transcriptional regulator